MKKQLFLSISMIGMILSSSGMDDNHFASLPAEMKYLTFMWTLNVDSPESLLKSLKTLISDLTILNKDCKQRVTDNDFAYFIRLRLEAIGKTIIDFVDDTQQTVLHYAADDPQATPYLIHLLLAAAGVNAHQLATIDNEYGENALHLAAYEGHTATVHALLTTPGVDTHQLAILQNCAEETALHYAATRGHVPAVQILFALSGLDPHQLATIDNEYGNTALHLAARDGHTATVQILLTTLGANAHQLAIMQNHDGNTALHFAASNGDASIVQALLRTPDVDIHQLVMIQNHDGYTAFKIGTLKSKAIIAGFFAQQFAQQYVNNSNVRIALSIAGLSALHYYCN